MKIRHRIMLSMLSAVAVSGVVLALTGGYLLWYHLRRQAEDRVKMDLNTAREFYDQRVKGMADALLYTGLGEQFARSIVTGDRAYLARRLDIVIKSAGLDILSITDSSGRVVYRAHQPGYWGDSLADDSLIRRAVDSGNMVSGTLLVPIRDLQAEWAPLAERARVTPVDTPGSRATELKELDSAMMLGVAVPVRNQEGVRVGVLRAGVLLNRNYDLMDRVQGTIFPGERHDGKELGMSSLFQDDVRISTNVQLEDKSRAVGTRVSAEVYDRVMVNGKTWIGLAWVVRDWHIAAYQPIHDIDGRRVGILAVGVRAGKFNDLFLEAVMVLALVTLIGLLAASAVAWKLSDRIARPVSTLVGASEGISRGDFHQELEVKSSDEIGALTITFNLMARSLRERDTLLKERARLQLTSSERLASIGRLAAGVAHEINNPLTGVLTFAHMLLRDAPENSRQREDLEVIIDATNRCKTIVRGLLGFSRQNEPNTKLADLNSVIRDALNLVRNQARINRIDVTEEVEAGVPQIVVDPNQIQEVAVNLILNSIDAMPGGGKLKLSIGTVEEPGVKWVEFKVEDTGCGIPAENLDHIFDPFFTTKPAGKGTGLGLAIAYGIVSEHGGRIAVASKVGEGTTMTVRLPAPLSGETR